MFWLIQYFCYILVESTSGYCPIRDALEGQSECDGEEYYNHCLSDPECEQDEKKCCYDGCGHSCIEPAQEPGMRVTAGFIRVREMSGKFKFFQGQGIVREFHNLSGKIEFLLKCQGDVREF